MKHVERIAFAALLLVAVLPDIVAVCLAPEIVTPGQGILYLFTTVVLYCIGLCVVHKRAFFYIISLGFGFSLIEMIHLFLRHRSTTLLFLYTWFKTPPSQVMTALAQYWWIGLLILAVWVGYYVCAHRYISREYIAPLRWRMPALVILVSIYMLLPMRPVPMNVVHQFGRLAILALQVEQNLPEQQHFSYYITPKTDKVEETVIVVAGECSYEEWIKTGYTDSLALLFDSVYVSCPVSGIAIPAFLSRATPKDQAPFFTERSVIKAFDEAGYYTAWISNLGYHEHFLMRIADDCRYLHYQTNLPDTALVEPFRHAMSQSATKHMTVLATQGTHSAPDARQTAALLHQLTDSLRIVHQPALLLYVGATNVRMTKDSTDLHVPMVVWANPNFRYRHRSQLRTLYAQRHQKMTTEVVYHSLLYLNQIDYVAADERKAIGSPRLETADTLYYLDENLRITEYSFAHPQLHE